MPDPRTIAADARKLMHQENIPRPVLLNFLADVIGALPRPEDLTFQEKADQIIRLTNYADYPEAIRTLQDGVKTLAADADDTLQKEIISHQTDRENLHRYRQRILLLDTPAATEGLEIRVGEQYLARNPDGTIVPVARRAVVPGDNSPWEDLDCNWYADEELHLLAVINQTIDTEE